MTKTTENPSIKLSSEFENEKDLKFEAKGPHHSAKIIQKKYKATGSAERNSSYWVKLTNKTYKDSICPLLQSLGTIGSFIYPLLPKHRIHIDEKTQTKKLLIKYIPHTYDFFDTIADMDHKLSENPRRWYIFEGQGAGTFIKYFLGDIDNNHGNALISKENIYIVYDYDFCVPNVLIDHHQFKKAQELYKWRSYTNTMTLEGFENLPLIDFDSYNPHIWMWCDKNPLHNKTIKKYATLLKDQRFFLNEKYFYALKSAVSQHFFCEFFTKELDEKNSKDLADFFAKRIESLQEILPKSRGFCAYFNTYKLSAIKVIIYEMDDFFRKNRKYLGKDTKKAESQWDHLVDITLESCQSFMGKMELSFADKEIAELKQYATDIYQNKPAAIQLAKRFYKKQKMPHMSRLADYRLGTTITVAKFTTFNKPKPPVDEKPASIETKRCGCNIL